MSLFDQIHDEVNLRGLIHRQQATQFDCSSTCLSMLMKQGRSSSLPTIIKPEDIVFWGVRAGVYLHQRPLINAGWDRRVYLCYKMGMHDNPTLAHWFLLHVLDFEVRIHDPLLPEALTYPITNIPPKYSSDLYLVFAVHFCALPHLQEQSI